MARSTNKGIIEGDFILFETEYKKELGLVKSTDERGCYVWYHMGGTCAKTPYVLIRKLDTYEVLKLRFDNEYAKGSLFERQLNLNDKKNDVNDLIDERHVRDSIKQLLEKHKVMKGGK